MWKIGDRGLKSIKRKKNVFPGVAGVEQHFYTSPSPEAVVRGRGLQERSSSVRVRKQIPSMRKIALPDVKGRITSAFFAPCIKK